MEIDNLTLKKDLPAFQKAENVDSKSTELMEQLEALFHPRSVAVVGVPRGMKTPGQGDRRAACLSQCVGHPRSGGLSHCVSPA
ncbi:MAG: hypothetical protein JRF53_18950 [Deltaproteobacteria bacterium]|nr:hypothetical protein [Deltaproteobacteria bacterium]